ncbi:hypothetical protein [Agrobacterium vitis]|uniref:Uncharacterized protein n=1 Tax=Agrobacterium vitis TaxID=373 RepID=A0ABD6H9Q3_AGRVI|nr:hypothetical protein [Agrobacterium vitis]MUP10908.1 hypothetical protein [Agrobacterium vitis]
MRYDRQLIERSSPGALPAVLPLAHVTAAWLAKEIVRDRTFATKWCDVFEKELLYFFVLRPAYRSRYGDQESHQLTRFPVVFIVKPSAIPSPAHVYPFDTGAAAKGAFTKQADPLVFLEDYAVAASHAGAAGHVGWAFASLSSYYQGDLRQNILEDVPLSESVTRGYVDVARMGIEGSNQHDKRASTVEIASSHNVPLQDNIELVIFPKQYLEGSTLYDEVVALGAEVELYDWQPNKAPDEFQEEVMNIAKAWYARKGIL